MPLITTGIPNFVLPAGISFIDAKGQKTDASYDLDTVGMPTHDTGQRLIGSAYRDGFNTAPSLPAGWTNILTATAAESNNIRVGTLVATSNTHTSGAWTNCTNLAIACYNGVVAIGATAIAEGTGATITIPSLTLQNTDGSSWVLVTLGHRSGQNTLATPIAGMTYRAGYEGTFSEQDHALWDTNGGVASFAGDTLNYATTSGWKVASIELKAA